MACPVLKGIGPNIDDALEMVNLGNSLKVKVLTEDQRPRKRYDSSAVRGGAGAEETTHGIRTERRETGAKWTLAAHRLI